MDIIARIDALLANTPPSEVEEFEVCRCLRDAKGEIERLRLTDAEQEAVKWALEEAVWSYDPDCGNHPDTLRQLLRRVTL